MTGASVSPARGLGWKKHSRKLINTYVPMALSLGSGLVGYTKGLPVKESILCGVGGALIGGATTFAANIKDIKTKNFDLKHLFQEIDPENQFFSQLDVLHLVSQVDFYSKNKAESCDYLI